MSFGLGSLGLHFIPHPRYYARDVIQVPGYALPPPGLCPEEPISDLGLDLTTPEIAFDAAPSNSEFSSSDSSYTPQPPLEVLPEYVQPEESSSHATDEEVTASAEQPLEDLPILFAPHEASLPLASTPLASSSLASIPLTSTSLASIPDGRPVSQIDGETSRSSERVPPAVLQDVTPVSVVINDLQLQIATVRDTDESATATFDPGEDSPVRARLVNEGSSRLMRVRKKMVDILRFLRGKKLDTEAITRPRDQVREQGVIGDIVEPAQWKAYGEWARPMVNGVIVHNATPLSRFAPELNPQEIDDIIASLVSYDDDGDRTIHPERWIARVDHPAVPPKPDLWPTPPASALFLPPPPSSLQLNPFLRHPVAGVPPIIFDLSLNEWVIRIPVDPTGPTTPSQERDSERPSELFFGTTGPNGSQPATCPAVSELHITMLADDPLPKFLWPMVVRSHHRSLPVTVQDVIRVCLKNFEEAIWPEEFETFTESRQEQIVAAYWNRMERPIWPKNPDEVEPLRRYDYLGDRTCFRGLEPAPDGVGFMMFVGLSI